MNSCLYECDVMHHRFSPKEHHLQHRLFMCYFDLDELDSLAKKIFLFGHNRKNFYSFCDHDHEPAGKDSLKSRLREYLLKNGIELAKESRVMLLTLPRVAGYIFNPISVFYCFEPSGGPLCAVVEVGNTFREMKLFLLRDAERTDDVFHKNTPKHYYVSPFSSLELNFDFKMKIPGEKLNLRVDDYAGAEKILISALTGTRAEFTNRNLCWFTLKYPFITLKVIFLIHWHALLLWLKRVPLHHKAARPDLQRDVLRPHGTLTAKIK